MKRFVCASLFIILSGTLIAQAKLPPVYLIQSDTSYQQEFGGEQVQVLEDKTGKLTFAQVSAPPYSERFRRIDSPANTPDSIVTTHWLRFVLKNQMQREAAVSLSTGSNEASFYVTGSDGKLLQYKTGFNFPWVKKDGIKRANAIPIELQPQEELVVYQKRYNPGAARIGGKLKISLFSTQKLVTKELSEYEDGYIGIHAVYFSLFAGIFLLATVFNLLSYQQSKDKTNLFFALFLLSISLWYNSILTEIIPRYFPGFYAVMAGLAIVWLFFLLFFVRYYFRLFERYPKWDKFLLVVGYAFLFSIIIPLLLPAVNGYPVFVWLKITMMMVLLIGLIITIFICIRIKSEATRIFKIAVLPLVIAFTIMLAFLLLKLFPDERDEVSDFGNYLVGTCVAWAVVVFSAYLFKRYGLQQKQILQEQLEKEQLSREVENEKSKMIAAQKEELEILVKKRTIELSRSLDELKTTQQQLIQAEKMASLGELTAGIAHEIQNPLNFVNNFAEVNTELIAELKNCVENSGLPEVISLANDISDNGSKILHHGQRASSIVKSMLQHSRAGGGNREITELNAIVDEYIRLSFHGFRTKDKLFNAAIETSFDPEVGTIKIIPQEIGRVLLNLFNNAFYALTAFASSSAKASADKQAFAVGEEEAFKPVLKVKTQRIGNKVKITITDNGGGIPDQIREKVFQPFFTTKPTGQGTGLGLSLSYDIITKAHGGELKLGNAVPGETEFVILLPG